MKRLALLAGENPETRQTYLLIQGAIVPLRFEQVVRPIESERAVDLFAD